MGWVFSHLNVLLNLDSQRPLALISNLASSSVVVDSREKVSSCNDWRWRSISTSWQTLLHKFAKESRSSLCLKWVYPPYGLWRAYATVKLSFHVYSDGIFTGCPAIANDNAITKLAFRLVKSISLQWNGIQQAWCSIFTRTTTLTFCVLSSQKT